MLLVVNRGVSADPLTPYGKMLFSVAPTSTPMASGICLPKTSIPCIVPYLVMKRGPVLNSPYLRTGTVNIVRQHDRRNPDAQTLSKHVLSSSTVEQGIDVTFVI